MALTGAAGADIFFIPEIHFAGETPELDDEGWWYQVRVVIWCRECRKCRVRKEQEGFQRNDWNTERKVRKRIKNTPNLRARRPRAAHGQGVAARDAKSESEEDEEERVEWGTRKYGVRMSPAHPRYVGRGDDTCGGVSRSHLVTFRYIWSLVIKSICEVIVNAG